MPTRRELLLTTSALALAALVGPARAGPAGAVDTSRLASRLDLARRLMDALPHRASAGAVGASCGEALCCGPAESPAERLMDELLRHAPALDAALTAGDGAAIRNALADARRQDIERGRVVAVRGWRLSVTEATVCALALRLG